MSDQLADYRQMDDLATRMVVAATSGDWDCLIALEAETAAIRERLTKREFDANAALSERTQAMTLIRSILSQHESVRTFVRPRLEELKQLVGDASARRRIDAAYGADPLA